MIEEFIANFEGLPPLLTLVLGLTIGLQHAFESDHIAAISTQITKEKIRTESSVQTIKSLIRKSSVLGALWGAGHTTSIAIIIMTIFYFTITIPENIFSSFEALVGVMLVFLGMFSILRHKQRRSHPHKHSDGSLHFDIHKHDDLDHRHGHVSYLIGMIHGLAGSGFLLVLLAASFYTVETVMSFILFFGIGSITGMSIISGLIAMPFVLTNRFTTFPKIFKYITSTASIVIGASIFFNIIF